MPAVCRNHAKYRHTSAHPYRQDSRGVSMARLEIPLNSVGLNEIIPTSDPDEVELKVSHTETTRISSFNVNSWYMISRNQMPDLISVSGVSSAQIPALEDLAEPEREDIRSIDDPWNDIRTEYPAFTTWHETIHGRNCTCRGQSPTCQSSPGSDYLGPSTPPRRNRPTKFNGPQGLPTPSAGNNTDSNSSASCMAYEDHSSSPSDTSEPELDTYFETQADTAEYTYVDDETQPDLAEYYVRPSTPIRPTTVQTFDNETQPDPANYYDMQPSTAFHHTSAQVFEDSSSDTGNEDSQVPIPQPPSLVYEFPRSAAANATAAAIAAWDIDDMLPPSPSPPRLIHIRWLTLRT